MSVNLEQIEMLRERANVSYGEAKEVLEKCNNDVVEALIFLESQAKVKTPKQEEQSKCCTASKGLLRKGKELLQKGNEIKFIVKKDENKVVNLPLNIAILTTVLATPLTVVGLLAAVVTGHKIRCIKPDGEGLPINQTFDKISTAVTSVSDKVVEAIKDDEKPA